ncbi:MAG TPA: hypothetical protein VHR97_02920 [Candidatus Baltobacteraceae bacterium]|nr:hypothetical protein [Candidatus Baltobacteraceae bacterium]
MKPLVLLAASAGVAAAAGLMISTPGARLAAAAATPPPTPPPIGAPVTPPPAAPVPSTTPSTAFPLTKASPNAHPTPPPPPARKGIEGVWEVAIQHSNTTDYTHFLLTQTGDQLSGTYVDGKTKYPLAGSLDGQQIRLLVTLPNGTTLLMEGKLDGTTDMIGEMTSPKGEVPFTASYRAKTNWIENVNPSPGGVPSQGGYTPP